MGFVVLVAARIPVVWEGRFWAEEGAVFFHNALTEPWWAALLAVHTGYINLIANAATLLAAHVASLEDAPRVTAAIALLIQIVPAAVLATGRLPWLRNNGIFALALLIVATPPASEEVWLNTITSQFHMMLAAALVLTAEPRRDGVRWLHYAVLALAPMTGPGAIMIAPLFGLRALIDRSGPRAHQAAIIVSASAVQFAVIVLHPEPARIYQASPALLTSIIYVKHLLVPLFARHAQAMAHAVHDAVERGVWPLRVMALTPVGFGALAIAVGTSRRPELKWIFATGLVIAVLSYFGAVAERSTDLLYWWVGGRYSFAPAVLFGLTLLGLACERRPVAWPARVAVAWILSVGLLNYFVIIPTFATGPDWQGEVRLWHSNPAHALQIWPDSPGWRLLPPPPPTVP